MTRRTTRLIVAAGAVTALVAGPALVAAPALAQEERVTLVVVLDQAEEPRAVGAEMARRHGGQVGFVYEHALKGFSLRVPERAAAAISRDGRVRSVERDQVFRSAEASEVPTGVARTFAPTNANLDIDRTDDLRVDADVAVIDSGVDAAHPDLNVVAATDCSGGSPLRGSCKDGSAPDGNGHGTHVAGSAAALDNGAGVVGMAPGARVHAVKVLSDSGSGYTSWIIAGIDWVTARAGTIEVANMSLGCECSSAAQDEAIAGSVAAGVTYAVAAGNSAKDASTFSPANHPDVITVSALADFDGAPGGLGASTCRADQDDTLADFSNFGSHIEIAAPGVCITSTWPGGGLNTISGTSMASPHVAGALALLASSRDSATPAELETLLVGAGNTGWTDERDPVKEPLLDVGSTEVFAPRLTQTTSAPPPAESTDAPASDLRATGTKTKSSKTVALTWVVGSGASVDVVRNGTVVGTTSNDGEHSDAITSKGGGTFTYQVCAVGSLVNCSNEATVTF